MRQTLALLALAGMVAGAQPASGPYRILKTVVTGGDGGFDYVYADAANRRLYVPRSGPAPRIHVFNLDTLAPAGEIAATSARGVAIDAKSGHGFATSKPVAMWDAKSLAMIRTIDVEGGPDGLLFDAFNERVYILSHRAPNATVIDAKDGAVVGTIDLGGAPEQAVTDGKGHLFVDIEDKNNVAVVDAKTMQVTAHYGLGGSKTPAGLAFDAKNRVLFVACREPASMVIMSSDDGKILATLPIGAGVDGAAFNPGTREVFSSQGDGTLTIIKEKSPTRFEVEQTLQTAPGAKTMTLDSKTNHVYLIAAKYGPPPATPPPGGRAGRGPMLPDSFMILEVGR